MTNNTEPFDSQLPTVTGDRALAAPIKVSFYPVTDDYAYIAEQVNKAYKFPTRAQYALNVFLALNFAGLPAVLWYFDQFIAGLVVFVVNLLFAVFFLPSVLSADYKRYFRLLFGDSENEVAEVELTEDGVWCRHSDSSSFTSWKKITRLEETKNSIYFFLDHSGVAVSKSGFGYDEEKNRFLSFAKSHVKVFNTL